MIYDHASSTFAMLYEQILELPLLDAHTHLVGGHLGARGLHDIVIYHMNSMPPAAPAAPA